MMHNLNPSMGYQGKLNTESEAKSATSNTKNLPGKKINKINKSYKEDS